MKLKALFSKVVAVLCIVTIFISSFHVSVFDSKASTETENGYELVTLSDLKDNYEPGNVTAKTVFTKSSASTWAGTAFEGNFEFSNTSGNQANMLLLGNTTNSRGLKVYLQNETTLRVRFQDKPGTSARTKDVDITAGNVQLEKFTNQKIKLKIQFDFKNYSTDGSTADVTATITVNDKYTTTLGQTAFQLVYMSRVVWLAATTTAPLYHDSQRTYETVTLSDLTDHYEPGNVTAKTVFTKSSALTWEETVFEGEFEFYNTSGNQANMLLLGNTTNSRGLKVYLQNATTLRVRFQDKPGTSARTKDVDIAAGNVQLEKFTNQKIKLEIQFDFKNYSTDGTTADVTATITVNDKYTTTLEQTAFQLVYMSRVVWLAATTAAPLYHNSQVQGGVVTYDKVTLSDLTDNYEPGNVTAKTVFTKSSALTWAGTVFEGEFEFYNTSGNQTNMLLLGNTTNSRGLKVYLQNATTLRVRFQDKPGTSARTKDVDIAAGNVQLEKFTNQKIKLEIQFDFKNYSTDGTTADVTATITVNDKYTTMLEQTAFQLVYMSRVVWLAATTAAPLYHNSQAQGEVVTPPEGEEPEDEPDEIGPVLNPNEYEVVALSDLTDNYEEGNVTDNKTKYTKGETKTWADTVFTGTFKFAHTGTDQANMLVLGHTSKGGLRVYLNKNGALQIRLHDYNTADSKSRVKDIQLTATQLGKEAIANTDLKLRLYFDFENIDTDKNTADIIVRVEVDGRYITAITQEDYQLAYMNRVAWLIGTKDYPLYHNSVNEEVTGTEEVPTLNSDFKELTFASYEIKTGTYKYANKKLSAKGQAELDNLDGVVFSDTVNFSDEPGACICFGGVKTAWQGLNILSTAKGELQIKAATGKPFEPLVFKSEYAGVDLTGQDVEFTMSFEYVDVDGDGQKNDVKLGVWFNGKAYRNKWYYLPDFAEQLGSHLGIYIPNEKTMLSIKTYTEPFVFEEFGFTKNWKYELKLKK